MLHSTGSRGLYIGKYVVVLIVEKSQTKITNETYSSFPQEPTIHILTLYLFIYIHFTYCTHYITVSDHKQLTINNISRIIVTMIQLYTIY